MKYSWKKMQVLKVIWMMIIIIIIIFTQLQSRQLIAPLVQNTQYAGLD